MLYVRLLIMKVFFYFEDTYTFVYTSKDVQSSHYLPIKLTLQVILH